MATLNEGYVLFLPAKEVNKSKVSLNKEAEQILSFALDPGGKISPCKEWILSLCQSWVKLLKKKRVVIQSKREKGEEKGVESLIPLGLFGSFRRNYELYGTVFEPKTTRLMSRHFGYLFILKRPNTNLEFFKRVFREKKLSVREQELFFLLLAGMSNKEIAESLKLSLNTVKSYMKNLALKLGASSRVGILMSILKHIVPKDIKLSDEKKLNLKRVSDIAK